METKELDIKTYKIIRDSRFSCKVVVNRIWKADKSAIDIMMLAGYHPAGYGSPFQEEYDDNYFYFRMSNSCD